MLVEYHTFTFNQAVVGESYYVFLLAGDTMTMRGAYKVEHIDNAASAGMFHQRTITTLNLLTNQHLKCPIMHFDGITVGTNTLIVPVSHIRTAVGEEEIFAHQLSGDWDQLLTVFADTIGLEYGGKS